MKIVFMGTPEFSVPALVALHEAGHEICAVYTQPPRPAGRGKKLKKSAVHEAAEVRSLPVLTLASMKAKDAIQAFAALEADCAVVVAYGQILPQAVLDAPKYGCLNIHASLLPRWRGAAPIHRAIMAGDAETGVCIMQMEAGLDTGPVFVRDTVPIGPTDTTASLHDRLSGLGAKLIAATLHALPNQTVEAEPQSHDGVTYAHKIEKTEAQIDWSQSAEEVSRKIRGLYPFPGAFTTISGQRVKILSGQPTGADSSGANPGVFLNDSLLIACGKGAVQIESAQRAGKGAMDRDTFLRGFPVSTGTVAG